MMDVRNMIHAALGAIYEFPIRKMDHAKWPAGNGSSRVAGVTLVMLCFALALRQMLSILR